MTGQEKQVEDKLVSLYESLSGEYKKVAEALKKSLSGEISKEESLEEFDRRAENIKEINVKIDEILKVFRRTEDESGRA